MGWSLASGDRLVTGDVADVRPRRTLGGTATGDVTVSATTVVDLATPERALDEWRVLTAAALAGLARAALDLGVAYVKERHQFGVPIGSFQSIQHRLADLHTAVDGARLLALEAADALDDARDPDGPALAAMALEFCGQVAEDAAAASLHFHGGYGFMLEYDVQLYVRRAKAWRVALGDPRQQRLEIARRLWGNGRSGLDRHLDPETEAFRSEVRAFLDDNLTDDIIERAHASGTMHDAALHKAIAARGYLAAGWPEEVGGRGRSPVEMTALMQELYSVGRPRGQHGHRVAGGGDARSPRQRRQQRTTIVPRILAGDALCCLGYSEPDAGSDVAAVQTRAVRDGDEWVINGQKMFTTMAHVADYVLLLTRTSPEKPKHKGLTMFLVPMDSSGIEIAPVHTLGGERTNITFYTDVRVPDSCRVGDVDAGWSVMHAALVYERNSTNWGEPDRLVREVAAWAAATGALDDPLVAERLAVHATAMEVGRLLVLPRRDDGGVRPDDAGGRVDDAAVPARGVHSGRLRPARHPRRDGVLPHGEDAAPIAGLVEHAYRHSTVTTIYGGTSEVQRGIIAERGLGLPRTR